MNLFERISLAIRAVAGQATRGIVRAGPPAVSEERAAHLLEQAEKRLKRLNALLAEAVAREQRADRDWQDAAAQAGVLGVQVDMAVISRQDDTALALLEQLRRAQAKAFAAERAYRDCAAATEKLRIEIRDTQAQLDAARKQYQQRAAGAAPASTPAMQAGQREESRLSHSSTQDALPADNADATDTLDQTRIADLLSKRPNKDS